MFPYADTEIEESAFGKMRLEICICATAAAGIGTGG